MPEIPLGPEKRGWTEIKPMLSWGFHLNEMRSIDQLMDGAIAQHIPEIPLWKLL